MQTLHQRFGPWIFGQAEDPECKLSIQGLGLDFRQAEDPELKLCIQGLGLEF